MSSSDLISLTGAVPKQRLTHSAASYLFPAHIGPWIIIWYGKLTFNIISIGTTLGFAVQLVLTTVKLVNSNPNREFADNFPVVFLAVCSSPP